MCRWNRLVCIRNGVLLEDREHTVMAYRKIRVCENTHISSYGHRSPSHLQMLRVLERVKQHGIQIERK